MTALNQDVTGYHAGDSLNLRVTVSDGSGTPRSISGASIEWVLTATHDSTEILYKSSDEGEESIRFVDAEGGVFEVVIHPEDTESISGEFAHEAELTDTNGDVATLFTGRFEILPSRV